MSGAGPELVVLLVPLVLLELGLAIWALYDLTRPGRRVRGESRLMWGLIILLVSLLGPILYLTVGRLEGSAPPPERHWPGTGSTAESGQTVESGPADEPGPPAPPVAGTGRPVAIGSEPGRAAAPLPPASASPGARPTTAVAIACHGLTKRYPGGVLGLDRLQLEVPTGSVFGLLGPNGAGKTTTLRLLVGLARPTAGSAEVAGFPLGSDGIDRRIGFLDQDPRYYGWSTGRELVELVGRLHGMSGASLGARVDEVLHQVGLGEAADRRIGTYSGGMRQRLGIAQALVNRPPVLILDEPVSSLDPEGRRDLLALIAELRDSSTVLFSTHVLADVERVCDRVAILDRGRLVTEGPLNALLDRYALPIYRVEPEPGQAGAVERLASALRAIPWTTDVRVEHGRLRITVNDPGLASRELLPAVVAAGLAVSGVERVRPSLEDVFLQLTGARPSEAVA
jgi:ABC-2 type transport system ATP-binding protein